jgi:phosphatidylinositol alpha 1,6-mannosyltransferase
MPNAIFTGRLTGDQLNQAYASLDVLIAPGRNETFCQVAQEGLAAGLCVIAPDQGATHELIIPNTTGFVYENASDESFKNIFKELLNNPNLLQKISQSARSSVEENTWENVCQQLVFYYENALGKKLASVA